MQGNGLTLRLGTQRLVVPPSCLRLLEQTVKRQLEVSGKSIPDTQEID